MNYYQLPVNFEFAPKSFLLDRETTARYRMATGDMEELLSLHELVPPMAVGALAMSAFTSSLPFPEGTVHVSQEFEFSGLVKVGDTINCLSKVTRNLQRSGMNLMSIELTVLNQNQEKVLAGKVGLVLPQPGPATETKG